MSSKISKGRILVVDDEIELAQTIRDLLTFKNYEVEIAENGIEAQDLLNQKKYDLVISDINMPKMDGMQLLSFINEKYQNTPVIFLSGFSQYDLKTAQSLGARAILSKPVTTEDLFKMVEQHLITVIP
jgi:CheY-like chemotaxis protein